MKNQERQIWKHQHFSIIIDFMVTLLFSGKIHKIILIIFLLNINHGANIFNWTTNIAYARNEAGVNIVWTPVSSFETNCHSAVSNFFAFYGKRILSSSSSLLSPPSSWQMAQQQGLRQHHYCVHISPLLIPILSQFNSPHSYVLFL
jgi:hypothetical protein